jgi:hypothetical protein
MAMRDRSLYCGPGLGAGGHGDQLVSRGRPYIAAGDVVLVEAAVGQRWRKALVLRVVHGEVAIGFAGLGNLRKLAGHKGFSSHTHGDCGILGMGCSGNDLQPVARHFVT